MNFVRLKSETDSRFARAIALYRESFPYHEQRESVSQRELWQVEAYHFDLIYDEDVFVGMLLYWETPHFIYVEHFCVDPALRNRSYGRRALALLGEKGKTVLLEIDPPRDETACRRKAFYERAGYKENPYPHVHPPYHAGYRGHQLVVMSYPRELTPAEYEHFHTYLQHQVMKG